MKAFLELRGKIERPRTLHPLMQYQALNYVDGKRTVAEIADAVAAEADAAGAWYYGTVDRKDVEALFESAVKVGLASWSGHRTLRTTNYERELSGNRERTSAVA